MAQAIDFSRSFLIFRIDTEKKPPQTASHRPPYSLNNARIQLDCVCEIKEKATGRSHNFVLGASCKTEQVGVERDVWLMPNADFIPILSADQFLNIKTYAYIGQERQVMLWTQKTVQPDRQTGRTVDAFDRIGIDVVRGPGTVLESAKVIVAATLANEVLVARTELDGPRYRAVLEYPIKTMNANERDDVYQTDTGPILHPDLSREPDELIEGLELAFAAFNCPTWIELIVRTATDAADGVRVHHYSKSVRLDARNQVIRLER